MWLRESRGLSQQRVVFGIGEIVPKTEVCGTGVERKWNYTFELGDYTYPELTPTG